MSFDVKISDIESNNGLARDVRSVSLGPVESFDIELSILDHFDPGQRPLPLVLEIESSFRSFDLSHPATVVYEESDNYRSFFGLGIHLPIFVRNNAIALYRCAQDGGSWSQDLVELRTDWLRPGRKIRIHGTSIVVREEARRVAIPQFSR